LSFKDARISARPPENRSRDLLMTFYEELEVDRLATTAEIERAFRKLARRVHPDLNSGDPLGAEARMKLLNEVRDTLTDPARRAAYDASLAAHPAAPANDAPVYVPEDVTASQRGGDSWVRRVWLALGVGAVSAAIFIAAHPTANDTSTTSGTARDAALATDAPPLLTAPVTPRAGTQASVPAPPQPAAPRPGRVVVHIGSRAEDVIRRLGVPDRIDRGANDNQVVFRYGRLRIEVTSGRVTGGDAIR
jgi:hypothetical protein